MVDAPVEIEVRIPERYKLTQARTHDVGANPHTNDAEWIDLEMVTWVQAHRGRVGSIYMTDDYYVSFLSSDAAMLFKLTFPV